MRILRMVGLSLCGLGLHATLASAQSVITGVVKDQSGAVLPGVTVEASSSALIEGSRAVATDGSGLYRIVDLRPGTYVVSFTLAGFETLRREGILLPSDFTATVNADMKVGALEESVIVSGASPTVDLQSTARTQVVTRETLDAIPTGRSFQAFAALIPSVRMNSLDIGGARGSTQTYIAIRGLDQNQSTLFVDGLPVTPGCCGQIYYSDAMNQEISYQTSSLPADVPSGGVRINMIPKDGGNRFSGMFVGAYRDGGWQASNLTQSLIDRGLTRIDHFGKIYDVDGAFGGPLMENRLWFFSAHRRYGNDTAVTGSYYPDGRPGIQDDRTWADMLRLTYQVNSTNKLTGFWNYTGKAVGHQLTAGTDPAASLGWYAPNYLAAYVKWTSMITPRVLLEVGPSVGNVHHKFPMQPGVEQVPFTPAWYAMASRVDLDRVTRTTAPANTLYNRPGEEYLTAALSYITGAHTARVGMTLSQAHYEHTYTSNGDLVQQYRSGVPDSVLVQNLPITSKEQNQYTHSLYAQDSWHINRLTVNGGLRWEVLRSRVPEQTSPAGRFVPARTFAAVENVPNWRDLAPRFGAVYDLRGDGHTALKYSANRYNQWEAMGLAGKYNPLAIATSSLRWTDLNGDDIAQGDLGCVYKTPGCEIDFSTLPSNFGVRALSQPVNLQRWYTVEQSFEIQHALTDRISLSASVLHGNFNDLPLSYNSLRTPADFTAIQIYNPVDGSPLTIYNVSTAKATAVANVDTSSSAQKKTFTGYTVSVNLRLPHGASAFGGFNTERLLYNNCAQPDDPNLQRFCDDSKNNLPFQPSLKMSGSVPLKWGIGVSGSWQSLQGYNAGADGHLLGTPSYGSAFVISRTTRYPSNCPAPCPAGELVFPGLTATSLTIPMQPYGSVFTERVNEVEFRVSKSIRVNTVTFEPRLEIFNLLNSDTATAWRSVNYGTPTYLQPSAVPPARFVGVGLQVKF
jgi:Carboxypeptidase regulatory-like domain/TonB-dependent Receptor Plug Domain